MTYFKAKRSDGRSYRTVAVDAFKSLEYGTVVSYKDLGKLLDLSPNNELTTIQQAVRDANRVLLKIHKRGVQNVAKIGYRVIQPREHMIVANSHQTRADKAMVRALRFYGGADLSKMTEAERKLHHGQQMLAQAVFASHQHLDKRIRRIEDLLSGAQTVNQ